MHQTFPKPARGAHKRERHAKRTAFESYERGEKAKVRARDNHTCRWPGCRSKAWHARLEVAHVRSKSIGGESDADAMILICDDHHRGASSLHSGDRRVVPIYESLGTNGPCRFERKSEAGGWDIEASERSVCLSETRGA
jgi:hypothetical protein